MKTKMKTPMTAARLAALAVFTLAAGLASAFAQGTAFTYQGRLNDSGSPANGSYDFQFILFSQSQFGDPAAPILTNAAVPVANGLFTTPLDFGGAFTGTNYWLDISVRTNGGGAFVELTPRQPITPAPYAVFANTASNLNGTLPVAQLTGTVGSANLPNGLGGSGNTASGAQATVSGGLDNSASGYAAAVAGGQNNTNQSPSSFVGGGNGN